MHVSLKPGTLRRTSGTTAGSPRIGLALGGGGARGLAHVLVLETLDEMGVRPVQIAGTSIGAVIGALYASGHSGADIRALVATTLQSEVEHWRHASLGSRIRRVVDVLGPHLGKEGLLSTERCIGFLHDAIRSSTFEQLGIPLKVVAADFWRSEQVVLDSGDLLPAVQASMALPGVFAPVLHGDRVLVDGGVVNPLPHDLLLEECDLTIAVDVSGAMPYKPAAMPSLFDAVFHTFYVMEQAILREKLKRHPPEIYVRPALYGIPTLDFTRAEEVYEQAAPIKTELRETLEEVLR